MATTASRVDLTGSWSAFLSLVGAQLGDAPAGLGSVKDYLLQFGYIDPSLAPPNGTTFSDVFDNVTQSAVMSYQTYFDLPVTGRLDFATVTEMIKSRCGVPDVLKATMLQFGRTPNTTQHFAVRHDAAWYPEWITKDLTYYIDESALPPTLSSTDIQISIDSAFNRWAAVFSLTFRRVQDAKDVNITVSFNRRDHGDGTPFDGPGGAVAHGFFPTSGKLHFDLDESWSVDVSQPGGDLDLTTVAIHEIGHVLGLTHINNDYTSVMFPLVSHKTERRNLNDKDIANIQKVYGKKGSSGGDGGDSPGVSAPLASQVLSAGGLSRTRICVGNVVVATLATLAAFSSLC